MSNAPRPALPFFFLFFYSPESKKGRQNDVERNGDENTEREGGHTSTRNLIMHGSWRKREEERWMERERGEDPPTQRERWQVERRGSKKGKGDLKNEGGGGFLPCLRVFVGGKSCKYTGEPHCVD